MKTISVIIIFLLILAAGCSNTARYVPIETEAKGIRIQINPQLELFHIMAYMGNANYLNGFSFNYKSDIDAYFGSHRNDNSVQFVKKLLQNYHAHLSINRLFFDDYFRTDSAFMQFLQVDSFGLTDILSNKTLLMDSLLKAVDSFADRTKFGRFLESHQIYYKQKVDEVANEVSGMTMIEDFESFWGTKKDNYKIVITLLEQDIHASWFTNHTGSTSIFFLSPNFVVDNDAKFGNSDVTNIEEGKMAAKDYIYYGATHEIGHTFLNPIMENYTQTIDQISFNITTSDPSKETFLCESFLRSLTAFYLIKNNYSGFAQMVLQGEKQQGYIYNDKIVELINDYSNHRDKYKDFNSYVQVLLGKLKEQIE